MDSPVFPNAAHDPSQEASPQADLLDGEAASFDPEGMALCVSGGGYKAAAFHLGGLIRLNELGLLPKLARIASVSGGSIAAAYLGLKWNRLRFDAEGVAVNFAEEVTEPLARFLQSADIDIWAGLLGLIMPWKTMGDYVAGFYAKALFGDATLQALPEGEQAPRFVILATNYQLNSLWRFARPYAADYRVGMIEAPRFPLAQIVAASSGFPPFFCPIVLDLSRHEVRPLEGADKHFEPYTRRAELGDGGIYDNMGLEPIWKRYGVLLVSNAGDPFDETPNPPRDWLSMLRRVLSMIHRQAENNRVRWMMAMANSGERKLAYWPLRATHTPFPALGTLALPPDEAQRAMSESVRLWSLKPAAFRRLANHGYARADAAVRSYLGVTGPDPQFPFL